MVPVATVFIGDGTLGQGVVYESFNLPMDCFLELCRPGEAR